MSIGDAFINPYTRFQSLLGVTVSYNLFDFGIRGGNLKAAKEDVKLKELETKEKNDAYKNKVCRFKAVFHEKY